MGVLQDAWENVTGQERFALTSPLSPSEAQRKLKVSVDGQFQILGARQVHGSFRGDRFRLRMRIWYGNPFQTNAYGLIRPAADGAHIVGVLRPSNFCLIWFGLWFAGVALFGLQDLVHFLGEHGPSAPSFIDVAMTPLTMLLAGAAIVAGGRSLARDEGAKLLAFLKKSLAARGD